MLLIYAGDAARDWSALSALSAFLLPTLPPPPPIAAASQPVFLPDLANREAAVTAAADRIADREAIVSHREVAVGVRETAVADREARVADREGQIAGREADLAVKATAAPPGWLREDGIRAVW